jgi:hypothetical protein
MDFLPYDNDVMQVVKVKGKTIREALEHGVSKIPGKK